MAGQDKRIFHVDGVLLMLILLACCAGMFIVYSASDGNINVLIKHCVRVFAGLVAMLIVAQIPVVHLKRYAAHVYFAALLLLVAVLLIGVVGKGAQRWLDLGFFRLQPSELMKLAMPLMVAGWLTRVSLPANWKFIIAALVIVLVPTGLIMLQPDLGTALLIAASGLIVIFMSGIQWKVVISSVVLACIAAPLMFTFVLHEYQQRRVLTLFNPWEDPLGNGYHSIQSMIAIGSGGLFGKGYMQGTQSQLDFLPERHTDFIFSVLSEEFGFVGFLLLIGVYLAILLRGFYIALNARSLFSRFISGSITLTFFFYRIEKL